MGNESKKRLAMAAAFLVAATAGSRILGLIREVMTSSYLGMRAEMGGFTVAMKVPNLVRTLLADTALSAAFIPVFSGLLEKNRRREAWQVAFTVTMVATVVLGFITVLGMVFTPSVIRVVAAGWADKYPETVALTVHLTRLMFPTVVILGIAGVFMGILNSYSHFTMPALAPVVWNLIIIGVVAVFSAQYGFEALAWGVLLGTVVELLLQVPSVWKRRWRRNKVPENAHFYVESQGAWEAAPVSVALDTRSPWRLDLRSPAVKRVWRLLGPVVLTLGIVNFNSFIGTMVATLISEPAPAYIDKAFRLFQLPQGMFAIAIGTVLFPALSRHGAARRMAEFRGDLSTGIRQIFFVTLPFAALFAVLSVPTIRVVFQYGEVRGDEAAVAGMASSLLFYSVGMAFVSVNTLLNRAFYSLQKASLPLIMGVANLAVNGALTLVLWKPMGVGGITLSTSIVSLLNFIGLMVILSPRIGGVDGRRVTWSVVRSFIALIPLSGVAYEVWWVLDRALGRGTWGQIVAVGLAYLAGGVVYCLFAAVLRMPELRELASVVRRRREPRETDQVIDEVNDAEGGE